MIDLDEGRLRAWLDGELPGPEAEEVATRVEEDASLRGKVDELRAREGRTGELLARLGPPAPAVDRVKDRVKDRLDAERRRRHGTGRSRPGFWARRSRLAQAAAAVLLFAGAAAAAIPGSPVREWLLRTLEPEPTPAVAPDPTVGPATPSRPDSTGITMAPAEGRIRIELVGLAPGAEIRVTLTDRVQASVYAPAASGLEGEDGRIRVRATDGPIRVELPRTLVAADLLVDGRVYVMRRGDDWGLQVPAVDRSATEIRLQAGS